MTPRAPTSELPTGTITFLFTDIEGSTRLLQELGTERWEAVLGAHNRVLREAIQDAGGIEVGTEGDAFFAVFPLAPAAVAAAVRAQRELAEADATDGSPVRVRMGMHTGEGVVGGDDYVGLDVHRAARVAAAGHGGQVLLSGATRTLVEHELPRGVRLRELGEHRLKDLARPEVLHDLVIEGLPSDFPPLRTLEVPTNLPAEVTSFVGRERDIAAVEGLLRSSRLVTLTGPGGSGKTRLAIQVASRLLDRFPDGVLFVDLASIEEPHLVPGVIASVVGTGEAGPLPVTEMLHRELRDRTALLVLDNFEQVSEAAPALGALLVAAPEVRLLVTSRGALRIRGEQEYPVHPLGLPDGAPAPEEFPRHEALALFVERATAVDPGFAVSEDNAGTVAEICRRLDGLPLALELAASRLRVLSPQAILERLDRALSLLAGGSRDLPARQRTLRGAIGWSYDLLPPETAALFRRLCVFAGGVGLEAAEAVCHPAGELGVELLDGLEALLDTGLVGRRPDPSGEARFGTLATIREYGLERLAEEDDLAAVRREHAEHFLRLAEEVGAALRGPDLMSHLGRLDLEHDNLRAALTWAIERDVGEGGMRLVRALWRFWHFHGDLTAGRRWAERILSLPSAVGRTAVRARALIAAGSLAYWQKDHPAMVAAYEEALAIYRELGDPAGVAEGAYNQAFVHLVAGDLDPAEALLRESHEVFEGLGDGAGVADALFGLSVASRMRGDLEAARTAAERSLRLHQELGDPFGMVGARYAIGRAAAESGDLDNARGHFLETLAAAEQMGDRTGVTLSLDNLATQELARGNVARAIRLAGASAAIKDAVGGEPPPEMLDLPDLRAEARASLSSEQIEAAWEQGRAMSLEEATAFARGEPSAEDGAA